MSFAAELDQNNSQRISLFQQILAPSTHNLLSRAGLAEGKKIIDLGCGAGSVTLWLCEQVGKNGQVIAIDHDEEKLQELKYSACMKGIENLTIMQGDAAKGLASAPCADIIYARFLLLHLKNPLPLFKQMIHALEDDGRIVLEEPILSATYDSPASGFWQRTVEIYKKHCELSCVKPDYGLELIGDAQRAGLVLHHAEQIQPILSPQLAQVYLKAAITAHKHDYLSSGILNELEFDELLFSVENYDLKKLSYCAFHAIMQTIFNKSV
jgi:SAM-dependent methyltransferase